MHNYYGTSYYDRKAAIIHYDSESWQKENIEERYGSIQNIWGPSRNEIWARGWGGVLYKYNGNKWEYFDMQLPNFEDLDESTGWHILDIHGNHSGDVYMLMRKRYKLGVRMDRLYITRIISGLVLIACVTGRSG